MRGHRVPTSLFVQSLLRRALLPALAATSLVASVPAGAAAAAPFQAPAAADRVVSDAAGWLAGQLSSAGTVVGSFPGEDGSAVEFTDWGRSLDSALALLAAASQDTLLGRTLTSVEDPAAVAEYTQGAPFDQPDAAYVGATAKLALVVELTGGDASSVGGVDLLAQLASLVQDSARFADRSSFGSFANLYGHAFALLALDAAGSTPDDALVQGLLATQCTDGSFPESYEPATGGACTGQVDATGLILQALAALDLAAGDPAQQAAQWLSGQQQADGSFPGEAPVNSAGYAVLGLNAVNQPTQPTVAWLADQQNADGGLGRGAGEDSSSDLFATAQALPALAGKSFQDSARVVARQAVEPTPSPTPVTPTATPLAAAPAGTGAAQQEPTAAAGSALPRTGIDLADLLLAGGVLLAAGGALTAAARPRRRGRHAAAR